MKNHLVIYPLDPEYTPGSENLLPAMLFSCGMVQQDKIPDLSQPIARLEMGEKFSQWVTFLGCSPTLVRDGEILIYMEYPGIKQTPLYLGHDSPYPARCPACRAVAAGMHVRETPWDRASTCPECGSTRAFWQWDFRYRAGWARTCLIVHGVSEGTAIPSDRLLQKLSEITGIAWSWLYR